MNRQRDLSFRKRDRKRNNIEMRKKWDRATARDIEKNSQNDI